MGARDSLEKRAKNQVFKPIKGIRLIRRRGTGLKMSAKADQLLFGAHDFRRLTEKKPPEAGISGVSSNLTLCLDCF